MTDESDQGTEPKPRASQVPSPEVDPAPQHLEEHAKGGSQRFEHFKQKFTKKCLLRWEPFAIQLVLAVVGISALGIYHGQLTAMRGQLAAMRTGSKQTDALICLYRQQLKKLTEQSNDIHELAIQAKNQSESTKSLADDALRQARATNSLAVIAQETYVASVRPYLGVGIGDFDKNEQAKTMRFDVVVKNAGSTPATHVHFSVHVFLNGRYIEFPEKTGLATTIIPGNTLKKPINIPNAPYPYYDAITGRGLRLELHISVRYSWPSHDEEFCQIEQYDPHFSHFMDLGQGCKPW